ncbi:MAG: PLDc N-terminal domain-containing protein [Phycisphaerae bacterium]
MGVIFGLISLACFIFWLWMLIDLLISRHAVATKILWVILMLFLPLLGSILYFFLARGKAA